MASKKSRRSPTKKRPSRQRRRKRQRRFHLSFTTIIDGAALLLMLVGVLSIVALMSPTHSPLVARWVAFWQTWLGTGRWLAPLAFIGTGTWLLAPRLDWPDVRHPRVLGGLFGGSLLVLIALEVAGDDGGRIGAQLTHWFLLAFGRWGTWLMLVVVALLLIRWVSARPLHTFIPSLPSLHLPTILNTWWAVLSHALAHIARLITNLAHAIHACVRRMRTPRLSLPTVIPIHHATHRPANEEAPWPLPPWETFLREDDASTFDPLSIRTKTRIIEETLAHFHVPARVVEVQRGPRVTQFGVEPGYIERVVRGETRRQKVKVRAITRLANDLALALSAPRIRIEAPVPGKPIVGIEVPNDHADIVTLRGVMESPEFQRLRSPLRLALGRDVSGAPLVADLAKMPHLLIAGATGSGKSVCINTILTCLLCHNAPDRLNLLLIDPKMVELSTYNGIPHLVTSVITDIDHVIPALRWAVAEMERRYVLFSAVGARHLEAYNRTARERGEPTLPYLVIVIDELADLMLTAPDEVEYNITRLAQMARATGIHLIVATQRPSVNVITGLIKANFPARIAFAVASQIDSRVILDKPGAETLLGSGDMLYLGADASIPKRAQACYVSDEELQQLILFWQTAAAQRPAAPKEKRRPTHLVDAPPEGPLMQQSLWDALPADDSEPDPLLPQARLLTSQYARLSPRLIQHRLRVSLARAERLFNLLVREGLLDPRTGMVRKQATTPDEHA
nr:DNA translocase FtsK [Ardenticatena sp.]